MEKAKRQSKLAKSAKMAGKSFGIRTADEYLTELVHGSFEEFGKQPTSNRTAIACAIFTWHFHDWVWAQYKAQLKTRFGFQRIDEFEDYIFANREDFKVIREIANGSKHFNSDPGEIQSTDLEHGFFQGALGLGTASHFTIKVDGKTIFFVNALRECIKFWDEFNQSSLSKAEMEEYGS